MSQSTLRIDTLGAKLSDHGVPEHSPLFKKYNSTDRAQEESRKLLSHILDQLETRRMPPSFFEGFKHISPGLDDSGLAAIVESVRDAVTFKRFPTEPSRDALSPQDNDDDEPDIDDHSVFSTDFTLDLLTQLKDVLTISITQKWQIFDTQSTSVQPSVPLRPFSPSSFSQGPRSSSPAVRPISSHDLLLRCISSLNSVCLEDCRFKVARPRPSRPPFSLQALILDIALYLIHSHLKHPMIVSRVVMAMIPALSTFPTPMYPRLLMFFESIFRVVLANLSELRFHGTHSSSPNGIHDESMSNEIDQFQDGNISFSIQVEEAPDPEEDIPFQPWTQPSHSKILSTSTPGLPLPIYQLGSLVKPMLIALLSLVDIPSQPNAYDLYLVRIFQLFIELKVDFYSDLLGLIAYGSSPLRLQAISLLATLWPEASGHVISSGPWQPPRIFSITPPPCQHEFVPWNFVVSKDCAICSEQIDGFGLCCTFCNLFSLHFSCYDDPNGTKVFQYSDQHIEKVGTLHFSTYLRAARINLQNHIFIPVHIFSLSVCFLCHEPLWGPFSQGVSCRTCWRSAHVQCVRDSRQDAPSCSSSIPSAESFTISWHDLRQTFLKYYAGVCNLDPQTRSYEEVAILHATLWSQIQILTSGIRSGSIVVTLPNSKNVTHAKNYLIDPFELHTLFDACEDALSSQLLPKSEALDEYFFENHLLSNVNFVWLWSALLFMCSSIKSHALLQVDTDTSSFEVICIAHLRDTMGHEFGVSSDAIATLMLQRMYFLGFFSPLRGTPPSSDGIFSPDTMCSFPLPSGLDLSPDVETLVASVEACLHDVDLSVNEFGFLQLIRRLPCDGLVSDYALARIATCVVEWIFSEDDHLATVLRNVSKLPGVRSKNDYFIWPSPFHKDRPSQPGQGNNSGDYVATRRSLLALYAIPWLQRLHARDAEAYGVLLYRICCDDLLGESDKSVKMADHALQRIIKLVQAAALFSTFDAVFIFWLKLICSLSLHTKPISSLQRLFSKQVNQGYHRSEPSSFIQQLADQANLESPLQCFGFFARSGVELPTTVFTTLNNQLQGTEIETAHVALYVHGIFLATWQNQDQNHLLLPLIAVLDKHQSMLLDSLRDTRDEQSHLVYLRQALASWLLLYQCDRQQLLESGLVLDLDVADLSSRRRHHNGGRTQDSSVMEPAIVDNKIFDIIGDFVHTGNPEVARNVTIFFNLFFTSCPSWESHEVDNFILKNGRVLSNCAWQFYSLKTIVQGRWSFLLRVLSADCQPFMDLIQNLMSSNSWETRLITIGRISGIILDVTNPTIDFNDRQWQPNVIPIFDIFFSALWSDPSEEIRLQIETLTSGLLPTHLKAISRIWDQAVPKLPQDDRLKLFSFMIQLHPHFPKWQSLSWQTILDSLNEIADENKNALSWSTRSLAQDIDSIRVALLLLAMQMITDGVPIGNEAISKIKVHLLQAMGFQNVQVHWTNRGINIRFERLDHLQIGSISLIHELLLLVDSSHRVALSNTDPPGTFAPLVGTQFVDIVLVGFSTAQELSAFPTMVLKDFLESLGIIIHKHDFGAQGMGVMQQLLRRALARTIDLLLENPSYDISQMCLGVMTAFMDSSVSLYMSGVISHSMAAAAQVIESHGLHGQDALIAQAKSLISKTLSTFSSQGVFLNLLRRPLDLHFFQIMKPIVNVDARIHPPQDALREILLRDTIVRIPEMDGKNLPVVLKNLHDFIEVVFHQGFSKDLMLLVASQLAIISRRLIDIQESSVASSFIGIPTLLIQHNKANSRDMFLHLEVILKNSFAKLSVDEDTLAKLIHVSSAFHRKAGPEDSLLHTCVIVPLRDVLTEGLRCRTPVPPITISSLIKVLFDPHSREAILEAQSLQPSVVEPCFAYLQNHKWMHQTDRDLQTSISVARLLAKLAQNDPSVVARLNEQDKSKPTLTLRTWNIILLATLMETTDQDGWMSMLFSQFHSFNIAYHSTLRGAIGLLSDSAVVDINHAYLCIKLWIVFARHRGQYQDKGDVPTLAVWNQMWPPLEMLVNQFERDSKGDSSSAIVLFTLNSCADLLTFVHNLQCPLAIHNASHAVLLNRLTGLKGSYATKFSRALKAISEPPQVVSTEVLLSQIGKEIIAAEKLQML